MRTATRRVFVCRFPFVNCFFSPNVKKSRPVRPVVVSMVIKLESKPEDECEDSFGTGILATDR